ncbi:hypothetical protein JG688_00003169 [Phytophthora aleatoria]|uniref:C2 DOCK-type domain-containing protein n=1 Tax=Phytophthora aleatoria TaxID=2496075 RepID=A0A8J5JEZ4_9STRA|nr:hypothetical protein JG688_00003169 [Phytophthora aleatoria]
MITPRIRFTLGTIEPLVCRLLVYDMSLGCRATEDFCFRIPGPMLDKADSTIPPAALMYVLPTLQMQNLYLVLKVSKVLAGDGDIAAAPYCTPDKFASTSEQKKLVEKAVDCGLRLGRFQQPLAWGTIPLSKGTKRPMTLFRQRGCIPEEQRISLISEVIRGILKEKVVPAVCEFDVDDISAEELVDAKFKSPTSLSPSPPRLKIADPFSEQTSGNTESETSDAVELQGDKVLHCREVQPFCTSSLVPKFGLVGSGPVAVSYVNTLYVYPLQIEKCQYRNIAIRVQLLQREVDTVRGVEETEEAVLRAVYRANNLVDRSAYALVGYHQKNPQFDDEMKICLPECLTREHHLLFTFYHVHCKKLQPNQPQQEVVGYAAIPILGKDGTILQDGKYAMNVTPAPVSSKPLATGGGISLSPGYVAAARVAPLDNSKTVFSCRGRVVSSIHSQDSAVAAFLSPFHDIRRPDAVNNEDVIVNRLMGLSQGSALNVRYFFFMIAKFVLGYLRHGTSIVRWSAFRTLLAIMEKATWNPRGSLKVHEMNRVLHDFVHIVFDEKSIDDPSKHQFSAKSPPKSERKSVFSALLETWLNVLNNKASIEENADTKRMSLTYSNVLLQLILKSMAMNLLDTTNDGAASSLPMMLAKNDEVMLERVLDQLIACAGDTSNGLLLQKEVNRSVAYFCRGVFLVVNNVFPARVIDRYVKWIDVQGDANSLRHIWFPFLHILVDFEFFPTVNGAVERNSVKARAWLAKAVSEKLLVIIDTQKEQKIRVDAVRLLRRMFAAQAYNPRFQGLENQEGIALLYYPLFPSLVQFTTPGKLLASSIPGLSGEAKSVLDLQKEMMACVGHLLCSVSRPQLPYFFRPFEGVSTQVHETHLDFTDQLAFYHRVVGQYIELLNDLTTKVHAYERWHSAFEDPGGAHDFEEIEEGIDRVVEDISPHWLLEEKLVWLNALLRLHLRRDRFAEAVGCKVSAIECVQRAGVGGDSSTSLYLGRVQQWVIRELFVARGYAKRADWIEKELSICELLLGCLKQQRRFNEYQEMLRCIDALVGRLAERQESSGVQQHSSAFSFYRVRYAGGCVPALITKDEFIYKRSKFVSLGEFVGEMKTMLRAKYPQCERVDVVPEPKPLTGGDSNPNVIFLRVTTVEEALPIDLTRLKATQPRSSNWRVAFKFAVPFTRGSSSSYGKTSEQMKRITFLSVERTFPCRLNRQRVQLRHEEVRCPIENSMDDIQKRCALLRAEIDKENVGKTDLKTLTLVLKGSVDTHVHGGIPEVLDSFLAGDPAQLVDAEGRCMSSHDSLKKRHELAILLVDFAQLCWQCLLISRETFRRSSQPTSQHVSASSTAFHPELLPHHFDLHQPDAANDNFLPPLPDTNLLFIRTIVDSSSPQQDTELSPALLVEVSPLQTEFERSFASLVDQLTSKIPFTYKNAAKLSRLRFSLPSSSPAPVAPLPDSIH